MILPLYFSVPRSVTGLSPISFVRPSLEVGRLHLDAGIPSSRFSPFPLLRFSRLVVPSRANSITLFLNYSTSRSQWPNDRSAQMSWGPDNPHLPLNSDEWEAGQLDHPIGGVGDGESSFAFSFVHSLCTHSWRLMRCRLALCSFSAPSPAFTRLGSVDGRVRAPPNACVIEHNCVRRVGMTYDRPSTALCPPPSQSSSDPSCLMNCAVLAPRPACRMSPSNRGIITDLSHAALSAGEWTYDICRGGKIPMFSVLSVF